MLFGCLLALACGFVVGAMTGSVLTVLWYARYFRDLYKRGSRHE